MKVLQFCEEDMATAWQRSRSFESVDEWSVEILYHTPRSIKNSILLKLVYAFFHRIKRPLDRHNANKRLLKKIVESKFDVIFIEKCLCLLPETLIEIKRISPTTKLVLYILDDFMSSGNNSIYFFSCIRLFDLIATNKKHNINEYVVYGSTNVYYFRNAFSRFVHRPIDLHNSEIDYYRSDVSFIGTYEKERANSILFLAKHGIKVTLWGWSKDSKSSGIEHPNIVNKGRHVYFDEFAKVVTSSKINLNFLRKYNRDTETTRTFEIPACNGFMMAERSHEQMEVFTDEFDAVYFSSDNELLNKVNFYLENDDLRKKIALNGYNKCILNDFEYEFQLKNIINVAISQ